MESAELDSNPSIAQHRNQEIQNETMMPTRTNAAAQAAQVAQRIGDFENEDVVPRNSEIRWTSEFGSYPPAPTAPQSILATSRMRSQPSNSGSNERMRHRYQHGTSKKSSSTKMFGPSNGVQSWRAMSTIGNIFMALLMVRMMMMDMMVSSFATVTNAAFVPHDSTILNTRPRTFAASSFGNRAGISYDKTGKRKVGTIVDAGNSKGGIDFTLITRSLMNFGHSHEDGRDVISRRIIEEDFLPFSSFGHKNHGCTRTGTQSYRWHSGQHLTSGPAIKLWQPTQSSRRKKSFVLSASINPADDYENDDYDDEDSEEMEQPPILPGYDLDNDDQYLLTREELNAMTITQLKQQLRLRGKKVTGKKSELVERLLDRTDVSMEVNGASLKEGYSKYQKPFVQKQESNQQAATASDTSKEKSSKRVKEAKARGANLVDVTEFVEAQDVGKSFRSSDRFKQVDDEGNVIYDVTDVTREEDDSSEDGEESKSSSSPEVWGEDARIVDDYEGRSIVVDGLSRTVIEYTGANGTTVQAYAVASRDSLKKFLAGGQALQNNGTSGSSSQAKVYSSIEEEVYAIQRRRELESRKGLIRPDEADGSEDEDDPGNQYSVMERDYGDWGIYTSTGAQLSSAEVQGVLLLSDVYGPFTENTQTLADKIAFECQPVVVLAPDLFRGRPWTSTPNTDGDDGLERNEQGKTYEEWRAMHPEKRVDVDIRAAAAVLRERYGVSCVAVWGTCYGGGRALEAAAGLHFSSDDSNNGGRPAPPLVDPVACIAWYPTRYNAQKLFGKNNKGTSAFENGDDRRVAVMAVFAENDNLAGAAPEDALMLKTCLDEDERVKDAMVKIFPGQKHGFAHSNLGAERERLSGASGGEVEDRFLGEDFGAIDRLSTSDGGDAEVAHLLSTAFLETYTRMFLPTVGTPIRDDENESWSSVEMKGLSRTNRDVRKEIEEAVENYKDVEVDLGRMAQSRSPLVEDIESEDFDAIENEREKIRQQILEKYNISDEDDEETFDRKVRQAYDDGAFDGLFVDAYSSDDSSDAYW